MKLRSCLILGIALTAFFPPEVRSQGYRTFQDEMNAIRERSRFQLGPVRFFPSFQLKNTGYDDNVYYQTKEAGPVSDFTTTVSPEVKAYVLFRNYLILSLRENPEIIYYHQEKSQRYFTNSYAPGFKFLIRRFVLSGDYHYNKRRRRYSREVDRPTTDLTKGYNWGVFYETPRKTSFGFTGTVDTFEYKDIREPGYEVLLSRSLNREEKSGRLELYYRVFSDSFLFAGTGYTEYDFKDPKSAWRNSYSYQFYIGLQFPQTGRLRGAFSLGYKEFFSISDDSKAFAGMVGDGNLELRLGRFGFRVRYSRDNRFSHWADVLHFIDNSLEAGASFYITQFVRLDYGFSWSRSTYPEPFSAGLLQGAGDAVNRRDTYRTHSAGLVFRIYKYTGVGLIANVLERTSSLPGWNISRNFIGFYLTQEF